MSDSEDAPYDFAPDSAPPPRPATKPVAAVPIEQSYGSKAVKAAGPSAVGDAKRECPFCGYSYFGKAKARCPDCAAPMDSVSADELRFANPLWVNSRASAVMLIAAAILLHVLGIFLKIVQAMSDNATARQAKGVAHLAAALLLAWAAFRVTQPEKPLDRGVAWQRRTARICASLAAFFWLFLCGRALHLYETPFALDKSMVILALLTQMPLAIALGLYLADLARRIPDDSLVSHATNMGWLAAASGFVMLVIQALDLTTRVHLWFFPVSFPIIVINIGILGWTAWTAFRIAANAKICARAGETIVQNRVARAAKKK